MRLKIVSSGVTLRDVPSLSAGTSR